MAAGDAVRVASLRAGAILAAFATLLSALAGCSGDPAGDAGGDAAPAAQLGLLHGVVVDAALRPLAGAQVTAASVVGPPLANTTGAEGTFAFADVPAGSYALDIRLDGYLSAQQLAQVVAGVAEPAPVQVVLEVEVGAIPFVVAISWDGLIGCAFSYGNLCSAPAQGGFDVIGDQSAHLFWDEYVGQARVPDLVQAEAAWEPTAPTSEELSPIFGWSTPAEWQQFQYGGTFGSFSTPSPMFYRLAGEEAGEVGLGVETGLVLEFYSGDPGGLPTGLTVNQPIQVVLHNFYGYLPPDGWRFVTDGAPPPP